MPQADNISDMLYKNLRIALMRYEDRNGHSPGHIFMESAVFWLFKYFNSSVITPNMPLTDGATFFGIPVKEIKENGYGIFLSDGPIPLEAYEGADSENVVFLNSKLAEIDRFMEHRYPCWRNSFDRICSNPKTNADSIRRMNDKQLSEFLNSHMVCDCCVHEETCTDYSKPDQCRAGVLAWLQKPVQGKADIAENAGGNQ